MALQRLQYYLWDSDLIKDYFNIRNGMLGGGLLHQVLCLAFRTACLSPRTVYHEVEKYQSQRTQNKSTLLGDLRAHVARLLPLLRGQARQTPCSLRRASLGRRLSGTAIPRYRSRFSPLQLLDRNDAPNA